MTQGFTTGPLPWRRGPVGQPTRGTTGPNRLRRFDSWICHRGAAVLGANPLVVDVGFGATPATTIELARRIARGRPRGWSARVVGVEIDARRVATAQAWSASHPDRGPVSLDFHLGGFDLPVGQAAVIRVANVLRQYPEEHVGPAWALMAGSLGADGILVEGTCDELGRLASWVTIPASDPPIPESLTLCADLRHLDRPAGLAARLPKILIHRNQAGQGVAALLAELDRQWVISAPLGAFGPRQRWVGAVRGLREGGFPVLGGAARWRRGEVTVAWGAVAPVALPNVKRPTA